MAVRGIAGFIDIYVQSALGQPLYSFQNYFPDPRVLYDKTYTYKSFSVSTLIEDKNNTSPDFSLTFPATTTNLSLVDECLTNKYYVLLFMYRWSDNEGLENPSSFNIFAIADGSSAAATADITTVSLSVSPYANAVQADIPWRKTPWTILGPLSLGT